MQFFGYADFPQFANMQIILSKGRGRNTLLCKRPNGTITSAHPKYELLHHDLAHFVVETHFGLQRGFYGNIRNGMSIAELSDREVVRELHPEAMLAEVLTRNLQAIETGSARKEQYAELVSWELEGMKNVPSIDIAPEDVDAMFATFRGLLEKWEALQETESVEIEFPS
jgi:hypothetical protein